MAKPNVGDKIYVEGTIYLTHEVDDFQGGACTIKTVESHIEKGNEVSSVEIEEDPGTCTPGLAIWNRGRTNGRRFTASRRADRSRICGRSLMMNTRVGEKLARSL